MRACRLCGQTARGLQAHWRRVKGCTNPPECTDAHLRHNATGQDSAELRDCLSVAAFGISGNPWFYNLILYDWPRLQAARKRVK